MNSAEEIHAPLCSHTAYQVLQQLFAFVIILSFCTGPVVLNLASFSLVIAQIKKKKSHFDQYCSEV